MVGRDRDRPSDQTEALPLSNEEQRPEPLGVSSGRRLNLVRWRWPAIVVGLLLCGSALTYLLVPPMVVAEKAITVNPSDLLAARDRQAQPMPSLLGLNRDIAQTVLSDAGLGGVRVAVREQAAAGPIAMVIAQKPSAGTASVSEIELIVSVPAPMPNVVGSSLQDGRSKLEQLGTVVQVVPRFNPAMPKNQILESTPKAGEPIPTVASLVVADPGDALTLASVKSVDRDDCSTTKSVTVNGVSVGDSVDCDSGKQPAYIEYSLSRGAAALEAVVGTNDRGRTGAAHVVILGDGRELAATDVWLGHSVPLRADLTGVMRMRIVVTTDDTKQNPTVVVGDAKLLGLPDGLNAIAAQ